MVKDGRKTRKKVNIPFEIRENQYTWNCSKRTIGKNAYTPKLVPLKVCKMFYIACLLCSEYCVRIKKNQTSIRLNCKMYKIFP